jgi:pyruvate, water dikinase
MEQKNKPLDSILSSLQERAKELNCLYNVEELLSDYNSDFNYVFNEIARVIPQGYQYPAICVVRLLIDDKIYQSDKFVETQYFQKADIKVQEEVIGSVNVYYTEEKMVFDEGPFLSEERRLIGTIADRIGSYILHRRLRNLYNEKFNKTEVEEDLRPEWKIVIDLLKETDQNLYKLLARKMVNFLCWRGVKKAEELLYDANIRDEEDYENYADMFNKPMEKTALIEMSEEIFNIANENLSDEDILERVQIWIQEDKSSFLVRTLEYQGSTLPEIADSIRRYRSMMKEGYKLPVRKAKGINASLIRRFLSDQVEFIGMAKEHVGLDDFQDLINHMVYLSKSSGKIGGKSVGLFMANKILQNSTEYSKHLGDIKIPKTWYITSDIIMEFLQFNNLEEVIEQKYNDIDQIRQEYPYIVHLFKNSTFPSEIVKQLSLVLEDFGDVPLIVRSSSLLEDRIGAAFSGKYKSLFVANQGSRQSRLSALLDAIAEVYSSIFSADPIEYRKEKGLLDYHEEMGIMIQEVVGTKVGRYFFPAYAGVAFSNNEFRWSPRINREDGLIRLVPGLGTRAVDRVSDDYPVLIAPGKPGLRVNISVEDVIRYSPRKIDAINLEANTFETIEISRLLSEFGNEYPCITDIVSSCDQNQIKNLIGYDIDFSNQNLAITFEKLTNNRIFIPGMQTILKVLEEKLGFPVDIEFAFNGEYLYLLQCRPQSYTQESLPAQIPKDVSPENIIFSANKYVSNGKVPDITHIVYVDPDAYNEVSELNELKEIGKVVGKLNKILPKRQFILIGPGRWGSKGDIKLGVNVSYSDINNTSVLIEVARKKGNYLPDLSFGTHFFQDLIESSIRYLPLYPDDEGIIFNEKFLKGSVNILSDILPEYSNLANIIHVIDIPKASGGQTLKVLMNADLNQALAVLSQPSKMEAEVKRKVYTELQPADYWRWRYQMSEKIASCLDAEKFGVKAIYVFGSTKNATAGPASDINLIVHFTGTDNQKLMLENWFSGWSQSLAEINQLKTGYKIDEMLNVHLITDTDIENKSSYAVKIDAVTDAARELPLRKKNQR